VDLRQELKIYKASDIENILFFPPYTFGSSVIFGGSGSKSLIIEFLILMYDSLWALRINSDEIVRT